MMALAMIQLHEYNSGTEINYAVHLIAQVFEDPSKKTQDGFPVTYIQSSGTGSHVRETVTEVLDLIRLALVA